ncbi:MAG: hypothetical protein ACM3X1_00640 [Ignavibacteriales bacterium]
MGNQHKVIVIAILLVAVISLIQYNTYSVIAQISISDEPFYTSTNVSQLSQRVIDASSAGPTTEISFTEDAVMSSVGNVSNSGTFIEHNLSPNIMVGTGKGIITSIDSNNIVTWSGYDLGKRLDNGSYIYRGIMFFEAFPSDENNELMFLDNGVGIYQHIVDQNDSIRQIWSWQ